MTSVLSKTFISCSSDDDQGMTSTTLENIIYISFFFFLQKNRRTCYSASNRFRFSFSLVRVIDKKQTSRDSLMKPRLRDRWTIFISIKLLRTMEGRIVSLFITGEGICLTYIYRDDFKRRNATDQTNCKWEVKKNPPCGHNGLQNLAWTNVEYYEGNMTGRAYHYGPENDIFSSGELVHDPVKDTRIQFTTTSQNTISRYLIPVWRIICFFVNRNLRRTMKYWNSCCRVKKSVAYLQSVV